MKSVIVHIGLHKTGTTTIQQALAANASALRVAGVDLLRDADGEDFPHHQLQFLFRDRKPEHLQKRMRFTKDSVRGAVTNSPCDHVLITSEGLSLLEPDEIRQFADIVSPLPLKVIAYVRDPIDTLRSHYLRGTVRGAHTAPPSEWLKDRLKRARKEESFCRYRRWSDVFGQDSLSLQVYEEVQGPIVSHFLRAVGLPQVAEVCAGYDQRHSVNPSPFIVETMRRANLTLNTPANWLWYKAEVQDRSDIWTDDEAAEIVEVAKEQLWPERDKLPASYFTPRPMRLDDREPTASDVQRLLAVTSTATPSFAR